MLSKAKRFFSNPVYLLASVVSVAILTVGAVIAFNAMAANSNGALDNDNNYKPFNISHMYYNGATSDVYIQTYYQEIEDVSESWKVDSLEWDVVYGVPGDNVTFKKAAAESDPAFSTGDISKGMFTLKANVPDSSAPGFDTKVWVYKFLYNSGKYYYCCMGTTTVGKLLEGKSSPCTLYNGEYTRAGVSFSSISLDESNADDQHDMNFSSSSTYYYAIGETKPYEFTGAAAAVLPSELRHANYLKNIELFYAADADIEYQADYEKGKDVAWQKYLLKKSTAGDFAFATNVQIPVYTGYGLSLDNVRADIVDASGKVLYSVKGIEGYFDYGDDCDYYAYFNCDGDAIATEQFYFGASTNLNVPIAITVKYDYSRYKSPDGSNIQDPANLDGTDAVSYHSEMAYRQWVSGDLDTVSLQVPNNDNSPSFMPQGTDVWCATEFWRNKDSSVSRYEKDSYVQLSSLARMFEVSGNDLKKLFTFNNETGFWEQVILIEPIFERCYLTLTYHDRNRDTGSDYYYSNEVYPYIYKNDAGTLLDEPLAPSTRLKNGKNVSWKNSYGYTVNYDELMYEHSGETLKNWSYQPDGSGDTLDIGSTITLSTSTDIYAQWGVITYHIVYEYHSPTGNDSDVIVKGSYSDSGGNWINNGVIPEDVPKKITFSKDKTLDDPNGLNIFDEIGNGYGSYYVEQYTSVYTSTYYYNIALELNDNVDVPAGTTFQYWSLTNDSEYNNQCYGIYLDDFKEGADGDYYCTVHAIWSQPTYRLVYYENKQDSSDTVSNMPDPQYVTITYSELKNGYTLSDAIPTYSGKNLTFDGWSLDMADTSRTLYICYDDFTDEDGNSTLTDGAEISIFARWIEAKSVTYVANVAPDDPIQPTGSVPVDSNKYSSSQRATVKGNTGNLTRVGYVFGGWNTASNGSGTSYVGGERILMTNNVILYAQWTPMNYKLHYNTNGKLTPVTNAPTTPVEFTITGFTKNSDDKYIYTLAPDKEPAAFAYVFKGWGETPTAEVNESAGVDQSVTSVELGDFQEVTDNSTGAKTYECTVYAIWNPMEYTLRYNANKQNGMGDVTYVEGKEVPDDKKLTIQQFAQDADGNYVYNQLSEVLRTEGFTFKGWSTKSDATEAQSSLSIANDFNESNECLLYAVWEENTYKLDYQTGEGHDSAVIPADESELRYTDIKGGKVLSSQIPTDTGYTFAGWQINDVDDTLNASSTVAFASFNNMAKTATATATWTVNSHNVTYWEADGITQIGGAQTYDYKSDVTLGENAGTPKIFEDKTWTGEWSVFDSPSTDADGQIISGVGTTFKMPDNDVKLKAVYKNNTYTVRYTAGYDGSGQDDVLAENIAHGSTHNIQANTFSRTGYDFSGWQLVEPLDKDYPANPAENTAITVKSNVTYKALWTIKQHTVTYQDGYSGDTTKDILFTVNYGTSHIVQPYSSFTRTGYTLTGWKLVSPTTGYSVIPNDQYNVVENVTYRALWTANMHTVKYEITIPSDVSYTKPSDEQIAFGTSANVKPEPTGYDTNKYTFSGWSSTDVTIDASGSFTMPDKDVIIRGSFNENGQVTLTYDANGATAGTAPDPVTNYTEVNEIIKEQGNLVRTGYTFDGWNASPNGDGTIYTVGNAYTFAQNTTIYAKWTPNEYHVRYYDINGKEITSLAEAHDYGTAFTVCSNANIPNITGKEIVGWKFKGGKNEDADGTKITGSGTYKMPAGDVEFQAEYNDLTYTVTYQVFNRPSTYTVPETKSYKYGDSVTAADIPSIEGYNFTGWNCSQVDVSSGSFIMPAENVVIEGTFSEKGKVTLTYNPNGATSGTVPGSVWDYDELNATIADNIGKLAQTGYKFNGWKDSKGTVYAIGNSYTFKQDTVLYAQWLKDSFNVKYYEADGTTLITTHTYEYRDSVNVGNGVTPTVEEGKEWNGKWVLINSAQKDADNTDIGTRNNYPMPAETVEYKAVLTTKTYTVTYVMEGDQPSDLSYNMPIVTTYNHGDTVNVASVPTGYDTSEYTFTGWDYNGSGVYYAGGTSKASFKITENVVLKGVWKKVTPPDPDKATITYTSGLTGADITDPSLNNTRTEQVVFGSDYTVHANEGWTNYVRPGYRFVSWKVVAPKITGLSLIDNIVARFAGPAVIGQTFVGGDTITSLNENIKLEAQWEEEKYSITYDANGATSGTAPTDDKDYSYNETATVKNEGDLAKAGAIFLNWNTQPNGNGTAYDPNAKITMTEDITLYAIWKAEPSDPYYTLKYDANGATNGSVPQDYTHYQGGESVTVAEKGNLSKMGCTFKEWNTKANGKGTGYKEKDILNMPKSDVTLYAIWVDSEGNIVSPGTGENTIGIKIALGALIISMIAGGCATAVIFKKRRLEEVK